MSSVWNHLFSPSAAKTASPPPPSNANAAAAAAVTPPQSVNSSTPTSTISRPPSSSTSSHRKVREEFSSHEYFLRMLYREQELWKLIFEGDFYVCVPSASCLRNRRLSKYELMMHILLPVNDKGEFKSIAGGFLRLLGMKLVLGKGYEEGRRVKVTHTSHKTNIYQQSVKLFHVNQALVGGIDSPEDGNEIGSMLVNKYLAMLRSYPTLEIHIRKLDSFLRDLNKLGAMTNSEGFSKLTPSLQDVMRIQWTKSSTVLMEACVELGIASSTAQEQMDAQQLSFEQMSQIVETYMLKSTAPFIYSFIFNQCQDKIDKFYQRCNAIQRLSTTQNCFGIREEFDIPQESAVENLCYLQYASTPVDKLLVMKETVECIYDNINTNILKISQRSSIGSKASLKSLSQEDEVKESSGGDMEFATDDLISVLCKVIVQAAMRTEDPYFALPADLDFCKHYHFCENAKSALAFTICHFEVANDWIMNCNLNDVCNPSV